MAREENLSLSFQIQLPKPKGGQGTGPCPPYNKEYTYSLACTRKIDVSCGLRVAHMSYDNDDDNDKRNLPLGFTAFTKRNSQPATAVALHD